MILFLCAGAAFSADRLMVSAGINYLQAADSGYREIYGQSLFYPEARVDVRLVSALYVTGGFGFLTKKGETPDLHLPAKSTQRFFTGGLAYLLPVTGSVKVKLEAGVAGIGFKEQAMDLTVTGTKLGYHGELGLLVLGEVAFTGFNIGYISATGTVEGVKIKLGGARASLCVGFRI
jgi:hypothetical protein